MVKLLTRVGRNTGCYVALATLTVTLVACGGDSGDSPVSGSDGIDVGPDGDVDGDGIPNSEDTFVDLDGDGINDPDFDFDVIPDSIDPDADGDGIEDTLDSFVDLDEDGIDDPDFDFDGIRDFADSDADGDGTEDFFDTFVDLDSDGIDDRDEPEPISNVAPITEDMMCGAEPGTDNASEDPAWNNNCFVRIANDTGEGQFANSLYTVGIQRVVFCAGFGNGTGYTEFADGRFGNLTEGAVFDFQQSEPDPLTGDGEVGPRTWGKLQDSIELLTAGQFMDNGNGTGSSALDSYGFSTGRCANIPLFYQVVDLDEATQTVVEQGWLLARNTPNQAETAPFSISDNLSLIE